MSACRPATRGAARPLVSVDAVCLLCVRNASDTNRQMLYQTVTVDTQYLLAANGIVWYPPSKKTPQCFPRIWSPVLMLAPSNSVT